MLAHPPLKSRIITTSAGVRAPPVLTQTRATEYKCWDMDSMQDAIAEVEKGMSQREAAVRYQVPRSTLQGYINGESSLMSRSGCPLLTLTEEDELATFLVEVAKIGYPHTRKQIIAKVQEIVNSKGRNTVVTSGWWQSFRKRHEDLTLKSAIPLSCSRAKATDQQVLDRYFKMLKECLVENDIFDDPSRIYNCDETGVALNPPSHKVAAKKGSHNPNYITGNGKTQVTVLACTNATGVAIPPLVVLNRKSINRQITDGEVPGTTYGLSNNGWMNHELFSTWFTKHFLQYANRDRPIILLMDGHSSHYNPHTIALAAENDVILFTLPPNTTHLTQPIDRACFSPLKTAWRESCHQFRSKNPTEAVTIYNFNRIFAQAWYRGMSMPNIIASYKVTGIYPYDSGAISCSQPNDKPRTSVDRSGLAYIPFHSPVPSCSELTTSARMKTPKPTPTPLNVKMRKEDFVPLRQQTSLNAFLIKPPPPHTLPTKKEKSAGVILTSKENLQILKEKQVAKEERERKIEEKRMLRVEKMKQKALKKSEKDKRDKLNTSCNVDISVKKESDVIIVDENKETPEKVKEKWWVKSLHLSHTDLACLTREEELTDSIMNASQLILKEQFPEYSGLQDVTLGSLLMFPSLPHGSGPAIQILHTGDSRHWVCTAATKKEEVLLMDSFWKGTFDSVERSIVLQIAKIYGSAYATEKSILNIYKADVQQQLPSTLDCGLFAVAFATEVCFQQDPTKAKFHQQRMRAHLRECIENKKMTRFPQRRQLNNHVSKTTKPGIVIPINLYCYCSLPEEYDNMIECDTCHKWFHLSCAGIVEMRRKQLKTLTWKCNTCEGNKTSPSAKLIRPAEFRPKYPAKKHLRRKL